MLSSLIQHHIFFEGGIWIEQQLEEEHLLLSSTAAGMGWEAQNQDPHLSLLKLAQLIWRRLESWNPKNDHSSNQYTQNVYTRVCNTCVTCNKCYKEIKWEKEGIWRLTDNAEIAGRYISEEGYTRFPQSLWEKLGRLWIVQ